MNSTTKANAGGGVNPIMNGILNNYFPELRLGENTLSPESTEEPFATPLEKRLAQAVYELEDALNDARVGFDDLANSDDDEIQQHKRAEARVLRDYCKKVLAEKEQFLSADDNSFINRVMGFPKNPAATAKGGRT